jgi:hypothetical protein
MAVGDFVRAYQATYKRASTDGLRANAPMREEVARLNAALRERPSDQEI